MVYDYFIINIYDDENIIESGNYLFQNDKNHIINEYTRLPELIYYFVTNYNLCDLELFLRIAGFSAFKRDELPKSFTNFFEIKIVKRYDYDYIVGFDNQDKARNYINEALEDNIIEKFFNLKNILNNDEKRYLKTKK